MKNIYDRMFGGMGKRTAKTISKKIDNNSVVDTALGVVGVALAIKYWPLTLYAVGVDMLKELENEEVKQYNKKKNNN